MAYRDDLDAARARAQAAERELNELHGVHEAHWQRVAELESELAETRAALSRIEETLARSEPPPAAAAVPRALVRSFVALTIALLLTGMGVVYASLRATRPPAAPVAIPQSGHSPFSTEPSLTVTTTPPGADVFVDGERLGRTPLIVRGLQPGQHLVEVRRADRSMRWFIDGSSPGALSADF